MNEIAQVSTHLPAPGFEPGPSSWESCTNRSATAPCIHFKFKHQEIRLLKDTTTLLMKTKFWNCNSNDCDNGTILTKALFPSFSPDSACRCPWWATGTAQCFLILKVTSYGAGLTLRQRLVHEMSSPTGN